MWFAFFLHLNAHVEGSQPAMFDKWRVCAATEPILYHMVPQWLFHGSRRILLGFREEKRKLKLGCSDWGHEQFVIFMGGAMDNPHHS